jgi:hypothetical protein
MRRIWPNSSRNKAQPRLFVQVLEYSGHGVSCSFSRVNSFYQTVFIIGFLFISLADVPSSTTCLNGIL